MANENTPKYERETVTSDTSGMRNESSRVVMGEGRQGMSPGVVMALVLAAVAVAVVLVLLFTQRREDQTASLAQPSVQPSQSATPMPEVRTVPVPVAPPPTAIPPARSTTTVDDSVLVDQVKRKILDSSELASATIEVSVDAGQVTLRGEVNNEAMRALAEQLAKQVKGVKSVSNRIKVKIS